MIAALGDGSLRRWDVSTGKERPIAQPKREKVPLQDRGAGTTSNGPSSRAMAGRSP